MATIADIVDMTGFSKTTVRRRIEKMVRRGALHPTKNERGIWQFDADMVRAIGAELGARSAPTSEMVPRAELVAVQAQLVQVKAENEMLRKTNAVQADQITTMQTLVDQGQRLLAAEQQAHAADTAKLVAPKRSWWQRLIGSEETSNDSAAQK